MSEGFALGPFFLRWHAVLIVLGVSAGALLAALEARRRGDDPEIVYYLFLPLTVWGTIGARLWHILTPPLSSVQLGLTTGHYLSRPLDALALWIGGFGIPGAILGGMFGLYLFSRKYDLPFWRLADILAPGLALAQAIGRIGNYFNQELYGLPTTMPWGIFIEPANRLFGYETEVFYHPLFVYESALSIGIMILLLWMARKFANRLHHGDLFMIYLAVYSVVRFLLEFLRLDVALVSGMNVNQLFFAIVFILTAGYVVYRNRFAREL
jgi:phosphatidylglycerol---prolipoprotein diacylglyceryl transferase